MRSGARQGCLLWPTLFLIVLDIIMRKMYKPNFHYKDSQSERTILQRSGKAGHRYNRAYRNTEKALLENKNISTVFLINSKFQIYFHVCMPVIILYT
jgi:predicted membrane protein